MSYHIKPEDIDDEAFESMGGDYWADFGMEKEEIAAILNAAIEAGLVSPPVRILRSRFGVLDKTYLFIDDNEAQSHASPGDSSEHWKGQTS